MQAIKAYEIEDCGVDHTQYFQGRGVSCTDWEHVALGAADNAKDAYADAVEALACSDWDVAKLPKNPRGIRKTNTVAKTVPPCERCGETETCEHDDGELYYYVAIYVR